MSRRHATLVVAVLGLSLVASLRCAIGEGGSKAPSAPAPKAEPVSAELRISLMGDVMFGRWRGDGYRPYVDQARLDALRARAADADLALANLETSLCPPDRARRHLVGERAIQLTAPPERAALLADIGVDVVSVANNHALDCGPDSVSATFAALAEAGVEAVGSTDRTSLHIERGEHSVVVYAASLHAPRVSPDMAKIRPNVVSARRFRQVIGRVAALREENRDALLVVSLHWGREIGRNQEVPAPSSRQEQWAGDLVDAGADVVWGHGSHNVQRVEQLGRAAVVFSAGNAHFDMQQPAAKRLGLLDVTCQEGVEGWRCEP